MCSFVFFRTKGGTERFWDHQFPETLTSQSKTTGALRTPHGPCTWQKSDDLNQDVPHVRPRILEGMESTARKSQRSQRGGLFWGSEDPWRRVIRGARRLAARRQDCAMRREPLRVWLEKVGPQVRGWFLMYGLRCLMKRPINHHNHQDGDSQKCVTRRKNTFFVTSPLSTRSTMMTMNFSIRCFQNSSTTPRTGGDHTGVSVAM